MAKKQPPPQPAPEPEHQPDEQPADRQPGHPNLLRGRYQKGESGNPGGRPKGKSLLAALRACYDKTTLMGKDLGGLTAKESLCEAIWWHAIKGSSPYAKLLVEQLCGRPILRIQQTVETSDDSAIDIPPHVIEAGIAAMLAASGEDGAPSV